jgi:hypothetical protein
VVRTQDVLRAVAPGAVPGLRALLPPAPDGPPQQAPDVALGVQLGWLDALPAWRDEQPVSRCEQQASPDDPVWPHGWRSAPDLRRAVLQCEPERAGRFQVRFAADGQRRRGHLPDEQQLLLQGVPPGRLRPLPSPHRHLRIHPDAQLQRPAVHHG